MSAFLDDIRRDRDAEWEPNPPPSPTVAAAALAVPEHLRALAPFVNQAATDLARIGPEERPPEARIGGPESTVATLEPAAKGDVSLRRFVAPLEVTTHASGGSTSTPPIEQYRDSSGSIQGTLRERLDAVRPQMAEPDSLFPRADYSSGGSVPAAASTNASGRVETDWPRDVSGSGYPASRLSLTQAPLGDPRAIEGPSGGSSVLDSAGAETIAELASRLLRAATRLEQLAQRYSSEAPRPYRSSPRPFRDRVEG